jgi:heterodisulfide reductase subunit A
MEARVVGFSGISGNFTSTIEQDDGSRLRIQHGVAILATGGRPAVPGKGNHPRHERVLNQFDFEKRMMEASFSSSPPKCIVMIQCSGSRQEPKNYCSRICCLKSVKSAISLAQQYPETKVYIFYRDVMTYGVLEQYYTKARKKGVMFIAYTPAKPPVLETGGEKPIVRGFDPVINREVVLEADWVSLAQGVEPNPVSDLAGLFGCTTTPDGFLREADSKWRPVDSGREGVFIAGLARAPARLEEALLDAEAAANRAYRIVSRKQIIPQRLSPVLRKAYCSLCGSCIDACPYQARQLDRRENRIIVDHAACQGCGSCAAVCPNQATIIQGLETNGLMQTIEALL